jgi:hypothetical protein
MGLVAESRRWMAFVLSLFVNISSVQGHPHPFAV